MTQNGSEAQRVSVLFVWQLAMFWYYSLHNLLPFGDVAGCEVNGGFLGNRGAALAAGLDGRRCGWFVV